MAKVPITLYIRKPIPMECLAVYFGNIKEVNSQPSVPDGVLVIAEFGVNRLILYPEKSFNSKPRDLRWEACLMIDPTNSWYKQVLVILGGFVAHLLPKESNNHFILEHGGTLALEYEANTIRIHEEYARYFQLFDFEDAKEKILPGSEMKLE